MHLYAKYDKKIIHKIEKNIIMNFEPNFDYYMLVLYFGNMDRNMDNIMINNIAILTIIIMDNNMDYNININYIQQ